MCEAFFSVVVQRLVFSAVHFLTSCCACETTCVIIGGHFNH